MFLDPKKKGQLGLLLLILVLFCLMTGNGPGTVRATVLCAMALLAQQLGRDYHSLTGLCAALLVLLAANPYAAANAGLQFSFLSTLGILLFGTAVEQGLAGTGSPKGPAGGPPPFSGWPRSVWGPWCLPCRCLRGILGGFPSSPP